MYSGSLSTRDNMTSLKLPMSEPFLLPTTAYNGRRLGEQTASGWNTVCIATQSRFDARQNVRASAWDYRMWV